MAGLRPGHLGHTSIPCLANPQLRIESCKTKPAMSTAVETIGTKAGANAANAKRSPALRTERQMIARPLRTIVGKRSKNSRWVSESFVGSKPVARSGKKYEL